MRPSLRAAGEEGTPRTPYGSREKIIRVKTEQLIGSLVAKG
jgi:hypothetical protein